MGLSSTAFAKPKSRPLFVKQCLPVCRHRPCRSGRGLIQRVAVRGVKFRPLEGFFRAVVVKPVLARLEARNDRVTRGGEVFRRMLIWRTITAADVTTLGASAKMEPPRARRRAFDAACSAWLYRRVDTLSLGFHKSRRLAVSDARVTLADFYNIAIRIANVAARLAVFGLWLGDELGASASP